MRYLAMFALALCLAFGGAAAAAPARVALVIANADYAHGGKLKNPVNDGRLIKGALAELGFSIVDVGPNLGVSQFRDALRRFSRASEGAEAAVIYYAGHGIEAHGKNWLIPADATLERDSDLDFEAVDLNLVLEATAGAHVRLVILDACRNNPFGQTWARETRSWVQGLAPQDIDDVMIIYAAGPGQTASDGEGVNSPFALSLARRLRQPGLPVQMLGFALDDDVGKDTAGRQVPFTLASMTSEPFYLSPAHASPAAPTCDNGEQPDSEGRCPVSDESASSRGGTRFDVASIRGFTLFSGGLARPGPQAGARNPAIAAPRPSLAPPPSGPFLPTYRPTTPSPGPIPITAAADPARAIERGRALLGKDPAAMAWFWKAARQGAPLADVYIGAMFEAGIGVAPDHPQAVTWFRKAAERGDALGEVNLGWMYQQGLGVPRSPAEARRWYRAAADRGDPVGQRNLALLLARARDSVAAKTLMRKAANQGDAYARAWLTR